MDPIVIVGGGIVGVGLAHALRDVSADVTLLEKDALGAGTTAASIAVFSWLQDDPDAFAHRLRQSAWETYASLIDDDAIDFERIGAAIVAESEAERRTLEGATETMRSFDFEVEMRAPAECAEFNLDPDAVQGAMYTPVEGYLDPGEIIGHWSREATAAGVRIDTGVEVTDVHVDGGSVDQVETTDGAVDAGTVINAAGPWSPGIADMVDITIPVRHTPGRILVLQTETAFSLPFVVFENGDYYRSEGTNQAFTGRLEKDYATAGQVDPDGAHAVEEWFRDHVAETAGRYIPILDEADVVNEWIGFRAVTPDKLPLLGPTAVDGFLLATGMSGLGVTLAPAVAAALTDYLETGSNETVDRLTLARFD